MVQEIVGLSSLKAMGIVLLGYLINRFWAQVPKHSVGSELSLHENTDTRLWVPFLLHRCLAGIPKVLSALKVT